MSLFLSALHSDGVYLAIGLRWTSCLARGLAEGLKRARLERNKFRRRIGGKLLIGEAVRGKLCALWTRSMQ